MAYDRSKISIQEWRDSIDDDKYHHIGEYYEKRYGRPYIKRNRLGYHKAFQEWYLQQNTDAIVALLKNDFEICRDMNPMYFLIKRKVKLNA